MKKIHIFLTITWISCISAVIGYMHAWHMVDFSPKQINLTKLSSYIPAVSEYGVIHFLTPTCSCSLNIFNHILKRTLKDTKELVVLIDDNQSVFAKALAQQDRDYISLSTKDLNESFAEQIKGVPLLVVYNHNKDVKYIGGYSSNSITPFTKINILSFINELRAQREIASLPVLGCAVSKKYKELLDPFGLKYKDS